MFPYIVCYTCGRDLGSINYLFRELRKKQLEKNKEMSEVQKQFISVVDSKESYKIILNNLCLHRECCRLHICNQIDYSDYY